MSNFAFYLCIGVLWVAVTTTTGLMKLRPYPGIPYWLACGIAAVAWPLIAGQFVLCLLRGDEPRARL